MSTYDVTIFGSLVSDQENLSNLGSGTLSLNDDGTYQFSFPSESIDDSGNYTEQSCGDCSLDQITITTLTHPGIKQLNAYTATVSISNVISAGYITGFIYFGTGLTNEYVGFISGYSIPQ